MFKVCGYVDNLQVFTFHPHQTHTFPTHLSTHLHNFEHYAILLLAIHFQCTCVVQRTLIHRKCSLYYYYS
jgi:hypothetical protein